jgi:hypothetical protein
MKPLLITFFSLFIVTNTIAQEEELIDTDLLEIVYEYEQVEVDSILSIRLPIEFFESTDEEDDVHSDYWIGYGEDDMTFMVHRAKIDEKICVSNQTELEAHYEEAIDGWKNSEVGLRELSNLIYKANRVYQAEFSFNQYDEELDQMTHNDYRIIQIKENFYQIGIVQPLKTKSKSRNDLFFKSIEISKDYQLQNQFTECNSFDLLFNNDQDNSTGSSAYDTGYAIGEFMTGFLCIGIIIVLLALVVFLIVRKNKKNQQKEWDQFNN